MDNDYESDPDWWKKIPMPSLCDWQLMRKIAYSEKPTKRYELKKYAENFDECKEVRVDFNYVDRLMKKWKEHGLINMVPLAEDSRIVRISRTEKLIKYAKKVGGFYDAPAT